MAATGQYSLPLENLRTLIANSSNFRTWTGTADVAAAKGRIHKVAIAEGSVTRPYALIDHLSDERQKVGEPNTFQPGGSLYLMFEDENEESTNEAAVEALTNSVGAIINDMETLAGTDAYLLVTSISESEPPARYARERADDIVQASFIIEWGI